MNEYYEEQQRNKGCIPLLMNLTTIVILVLVLVGGYIFYNAWQGDRLDAGYQQPPALQATPVPNTVPNTVTETVIVTVVAPVTPTPAISLVPWQRPITPQQYDLCLNNQNINPACPGYGGER